VGILTLPGKKYGKGVQNILRGVYGVIDVLHLARVENSKNYFITNGF